MIVEENNQLKSLLFQHGIPWNGIADIQNNISKTGNGHHISDASNSGSFALGSQTYSPPPTLTSPCTSNYHNKSSPNSSLVGRGIGLNRNQQLIDYDQTGIDFVLTYAESSKTYNAPLSQ